VEKNWSPDVPDVLIMSQDRRLTCFEVLYQIIFFLKCLFMVLKILCSVIRINVFFLDLYGSYCALLRFCLSVYGLKNSLLLLDFHISEF
jgi:hypothetical protein